VTDQAHPDPGGSPLAAWKRNHGSLVPADCTALHVALDALARARAEVVLPKVRDGYVQHQLDTHGPNHCQVGTVDLAYVLHGALGVGLNRWRLRPEDLPPPETFEPVAGDRVELVEVHVSDADMADACLLASELDVQVSAVFSAALATGLAKLSGDIETNGPFLPPTRAAGASET